MEEKRKERQTVPKKPAARCEDCEFYDYDENWETYTCRVSLDEDEMGRFTSGQTGGAPTSGTTTSIKAYTNRFRCALRNRRFVRRFLVPIREAFARAHRMTARDTPRTPGRGRCRYPVRTARCGGRNPTAPLVG